MGEIWSKTCEQGKDWRDQLERIAAADGQWVPDTPTSLHQLGATTIILHQSNRLNPVK